VGVLDKAVAILAALEREPLGLAALVDVTGMSRPTAHRLACALEAHGLVRRDDLGESVQLYVRDGERRVCTLSLESPHGLRTIVPLGAALSLEVGSAGKVLRGVTGPKGWAESVGEREEGVASVSAPVVDGAGRVVAAVSVSGPIQRTTKAPGRRYGAAVVAAAREVTELIASSSTGTKRSG
jgi:DNA-binding IclR family transcriptional regulator